MSDTSQWAPAGSTPETLWAERSMFAGIHLGAVGFGVHATLFFLCFNVLWPRRHHRKELVFLIYITSVFLLSNIGNATMVRFKQMSFIDNRGNAYFIEQSNALPAVLCNCVYITLSWFQDVLLLYRFWIIFGKRRWTVIFPALVFFGSLVLSCLLIVMLSRPTMTLWSNISAQLFIASRSISISFNIIITVLIVGRLLFVRYQTKAILHQNTPYLTISAMLIESAFLYSTNGLIFLVAFGLNSPVQNLALALLGQTQSIAPLLIILRVAQGKAWSNDTSAAVISEIHFSKENAARPEVSVTVLDTFSSQSGSHPSTQHYRHSKDGNDESSLWVQADWVNKSRRFRIRDSLV